PFIPSSTERGLLIWKGKPVACRTHNLTNAQRAVRKVGCTMAEVRVRLRWAAAGQTMPDQLGTSTARPTLPRLFQCVEGIAYTISSNQTDPLHRSPAPDRPASPHIMLARTLL